MKTHALDFLRLLRISAVAVAAAGCAQDDLSDLAPDGYDSGQKPTVIAIGPITAEPERWKRLTRFLRKGLADELRQSSLFLPQSSPPPAANAAPLQVTGELLDVDEGNLEGRVALGWGVGAIAMVGRFRVADAEGRTLAVFDKRREEDGEGFDELYGPVTWEQVAEEFGRETARSIIDWQERRDTTF